MAAWGGLTNSCEKKRNEKQRRKERYKHLNAEFQRIPMRDKKALISNQCKDIEENNRMGKTRDLLRETLFSWAPKSLQRVTAAMKLKEACSLEEKL